MCTTSWCSPRTDSTSMYSGSSVVKNVTSASHQPCSRTLPWSISHACNETAAASESTRQVRDCRRYRVNRPTAASTDPAHHGSQAGTASRGALRFAASLDRILTPSHRQSLRPCRDRGLGERRLPGPDPEHEELLAHHSP